MISLVLFLLGSPTFAANGSGVEDGFDAPPVTVWRRALPGGVSGSASHSERSTPVPTDDGLLLGVDSGSGLFLLSQKDGRQLRHFAADASVQGSPVTLEDRIVFGDVAGNTYCYDHDGNLLWRHESGSPILSTPRIYDGIVYLTNVDDLTVALGLDTGKLEWQYQRPKDAGRQAELALFSAPTPTISSGALVTGYSDGFLVGFNPLTGDVLWDVQVGEGRYPDIIATPTPGEADLYASGYFKPLMAIDANTRNIRWRFEAGAASAATLAPGDSLLHPGSDGILRSLNTLTGGLNWSWNSGGNGALTTPVLTPVGVLIGASDGGLYLIDQETGKQKWEAKYDFLLDGVTSTPVVVGRDVFFVSNAGFLYKLTAPKDDHTDHGHSADGWSRLVR